MLSEADYLRATARWSSLGLLDLIVLLASPLALALALLGARPLGARSRPTAAVCAVLLVLYGNELWLSPFATRSTLDLLRGLPLLAVPVSIAGGLALEARPRAGPWLLAACALYAVFSVALLVPRACHVRAIALDELRELQVARCAFRWRGPAIQPGPHAGAGALNPDPRPPARGRSG
jgi:hypothetical protein